MDQLIKNINITLLSGKKMYFASDFHLGIPNFENSLIREKKIIAWLSSIQNDAQAIFLVGDLFDFWFEYQHVVPKGYIRFLGKLAELSDSGIALHIFTGNHDVWYFDYLEKELKAKIYRHPIVLQVNQKRIFLGHGDGLGPKDFGYKILKKLMTNKIAQFLFSCLHPDWGTKLAQFFSGKSRLANHLKDEVYLGDDQEWLVIFCKNYLLKDPNMDYFVFGHRHLPLHITLNDKSKYINLGEWINYSTYAVFDGKTLELQTFDIKN